MVEAGIAIIAGLFMLVNTMITRNTNKKVKTQNGMDVGEYVEKTYYKLGAVEQKLDTHINDRGLH